MNQSRPPVVTILGHVDHGKTTLLDFIRKTAVAASEHGGITQAIGAYQVEVEGKKITFIDTPGHAAFEKMRLRGAEAADISVLVIAIDDLIMPQTIEALKHIKKAGTPFVVAINKIDLPGINVKVQMEKVKKQLSDQEVLIEEYGGEVPIVPISAKTGEGINDLLTNINLLSEIHELKGDSEKQASGVILESHLDKFKGPLATILIRDGSLRKGDLITAGTSRGKVKSVIDWAGNSLETAGPSTPVEVLGFETVPQIGSRLFEEKAAPTLVKELNEGLLGKLRQKEESVLNVVIKTDNQGSLEAIGGIIDNLNKEVKHIKIVHQATGDITDSDVEMAQAVKGIILGFKVKISSQAERIAKTEHILVRIYNIIYELAQEVEDVVNGMLVPGEVEEIFGRMQIIAEFPYGKNEKIAGCRVLDGVVSKGPRVRIKRNDNIVWEGKIKSLKKVKEEVNKVEKGSECGIVFDGQSNFEVGDIIESFRLL